MHKKRPLVICLVFKLTFP